MAVLCDTHLRLVNKNRLNQLLRTEVDGPAASNRSSVERHVRFRDPLLRIPGAAFWVVQARVLVHQPCTTTIAYHFTTFLMSQQPLHDHTKGSDQLSSATLFGRRREVPSASASSHMQATIFLLCASILSGRLRLTRPGRLWPGCRGSSIGGCSILEGPAILRKECGAPAHRCSRNLGWSTRAPVPYTHCEGRVLRSRRLASLLQ